ncbi:MAG: JAB domain-containing protein, partial [Methanomicrobium sp.]|nr:JAB domain-containing protein [Methanomicrobium sp.]
TISKGLLNQSLVHPREVFADAIVERCASVILVHNHPSGNLKPSQADLGVTKRLCNSGNILGIEVLDHVIVTKKGWVSLKKEGLMPESV